MSHHHVTHRARSLTAETLGMALYGGSQRPMTFWRARSPESHLSPLTYENKIKTTYVRLTNILIISCDAQEANVCITFVLVLVGYHLECRWKKKKNSVWRNMAPPWTCLFSTALRKWIQLCIPSLSVDHITVNSEIKKKSLGMRAISSDAYFKSTVDWIWRIIWLLKHPQFLLACRT